MRDSQIEQSSWIPPHFNRAFVQLFGTVDVTLLEFLCALFETLYSLSLYRIGSSRMRRKGASVS